jgi:hypothetical protein
MGYKSNTADAQFRARIAKMWTERSDGMWRRTGKAGEAQGAFASFNGALENELALRDTPRTFLDFWCSVYICFIV